MPPAVALPRRAAGGGLAAALLAAASCGPALAPIPPTPAPAARADTAAPAPGFAWGAGERRYLIRTGATIVVAGDTAEARDSVVTTTHVTLRVADGAAPRRLAGTVDSVRVAAGSRVPAVPPDVAFPVRVEGTVAGGRVSVARPAPPAAGANPCEGVPPSDAIVAPARDLLPSLPARLAPGTRWEESTATTACRGGVAITTTAQHRYHVTGPGAWDGRPGTRVERASTFTVSGAGEQAGEAVSTTGRGTGTATYILDLPTGTLLGATSGSTLELTFVGGGRQQRVVQRAETVVRPVGG